jgi:type VI secretion system secreted protein Hcp
MSRGLFVLLTGLGLLATALPTSAQEIYCTITGHGGLLKGSNGSTQIPVLYLTEEVSTTYDTTSGQASGKRTHEPLKIVKELDATSPQLFSDAVTNEVLPAVQCTFYRQSPDGRLQAYFRISLTNATIVDYRDAGDGVNGDTSADERERISFTYQKIELDDLTSSTTATDDWYTE